MVFLPMAQAPHKADAKELIYSLPIHEFTSFFSTKIIFVGMLKQTFPRKTGLCRPQARAKLLPCGNICSLSAAQRQTAPIAEGRQHPLFRTEPNYPVLPHMEMNIIEL